ncbi:hypothetical protein [Pseudobacteroides cellulosolvens]|uniref:hypothetical protein n=1 Tax=Pseudobacteroides cellulosolvens TaxID=35825 RepID=UPI0005617A31|nr:hypothetical protein [Pseudobacteroides cellulosolvens]
MQLYWVDGIKIINKAEEKREEEKAWQMWLTKFPHMTSKTFIPFSSFFKKAREPQELIKRSAEEILQEAKEIRKELGKGW